MTETPPVTPPVNAGASLLQPVLVPIDSSSSAPVNWQAQVRHIAWFIVTLAGAFGIQIILPPAWQKPPAVVPVVVTTTGEVTATKPAPASPPANAGGSPTGGSLSPAEPSTREMLAEILKAIKEQKPSPAPKLVP